MTKSLLTLALLSLLHHPQHDGGVLVVTAAAAAQGAATTGGGEADTEHGGEGTTSEDRTWGGGQHIPLPLFDTLSFWTHKLSTTVFPSSSSSHSSSPSTTFTTATKIHTVSSADVDLTTDAAGEDAASADDDEVAASSSSTPSSASSSSRFTLSSLFRFGNWLASARFDIGPDTWLCLAVLPLYFLLRSGVKYYFRKAYGIDVETFLASVDPNNTKMKKMKEQQQQQRGGENNQGENENSSSQLPIASVHSRKVQEFLMKKRQMKREEISQYKEKEDSNSNSNVSSSIADSQAQAQSHKKRANTTASQQTRSKKDTSFSSKKATSEKTSSSTHQKIDPEQKDDARLLTTSQAQVEPGDSKRRNESINKKNTKKQQKQSGCGNSALRLTQEEILRQIELDDIAERDGCPNLLPT